MNEATVYHGDSFDEIRTGDICHKCRKPFQEFDMVEWIELHNNTFYARHKLARECNVTFE